VVGIPLVVIEDAKHAAHLLGVGDGCVVLHDDRLERIAQIGSWITFASARGNAIPEHLAAGMAHAVCRFDGPARFDLAQGLQQLGCGDLGNGRGADP
jgi:hypothetical protein